MFFYQPKLFLGEFRKKKNCEKRLLASSPSARPSFRMEQLDSHWTDVHEILYSRTSWKSIKKIQVSLKSGMNNG